MTESRKTKVKAENSKVGAVAGAEDIMIIYWKRNHLYTDTSISQILTHTYNQY